MCNAAIDWRVNSGLYNRLNIGCFVIDFRAVVNFIYINLLVRMSSIHRINCVPKFDLLKCLKFTNFNKTNKQA